ncbi:MAG: hypothetical protein ACFFCS_11625 [Candidatus Hodarchaeota archaeon]
MSVKERVVTGFKKFLTSLQDEAHQVSGTELPPVTDEEIENFDMEKYKGFDRVGFARPLGGWFYQFFYALLSSGVIVAMMPMMLAWFYPEPESKAYVGVAGQLYSILFFTFNVPTNFAIERWVSDYRIKNPRKMCEYISFNMWYQMITGLILVTSTSMYTIWIVKSGNLAYTSWLMLVLITREYPACLGLFMHTIMGLQRFDLQSQAGFIEGIVSRVVEIVFVVFGRIVIGANPVIGPLLGTAIGYAIGTYIDDFVNSLIAAMYLRIELKRMGLGLKHIIKPRFSKEVVKTAFWFGLKNSIPGLFGTVFGFILFFQWYELVPAYATFKILSGVADDVADLMKSSAGIEDMPAVSEAINNGKYKLGSYIIASNFKYYGFFTIGIGCLLIGFVPLIFTVLLEARLFGDVSAENYILAVPFLIPNILATMFEQPSGDSGRIITICNRPLFKGIMDILFTVLNFIWNMLIIQVWQIPQTYGMAALIWLIPLGGLPLSLTRMVINWWYVNKYICKISSAFKKVFWQTFVAPVIPGFINIGMGFAWNYWVFPPLAAAVTDIPAAIISVMFAFGFGLIFCFIILYGFFGGWDDHSLQIFKEAIAISGPSRILFVPVYGLTAALVKISPLHNKFPMEYKEAVREMKELMIQRDKNTEKVKEGLL